MSENQINNLNRRHFLKFGLGALTAGLIVPTSTAWTRENAVRSLVLYNTHNGEWFRGAYWEKGLYIPDSLKNINHLLRDSRNGTVASIDCKLLDLLDNLKKKIGTSKPYDVICGYRSPETNQMLRKRSGGVAKNSLHMQGQAVDVRVGGVALRNLRDAAKSFKAGGVGYYPRSGFIHVDVRDKPYYW